MSFTNHQIQIEDLPKIENIEYKAVSKRYLTILFINAFLFFGAFIAAAIAIKIFAVNDSSFHDVFWYIISGIVLLLILQVVILKLGFKKRKYALREKDIIYSQGLFNNKTTSLPFNRIQHIEVSRGLLERKLNISTLKMYSAGESGGDISIKGLPKDVADAQYAFLTNIINERS